MRAARVFAVVAVLPALSACSARQAHEAGQAWQRNECRHAIDTEDYRRCMERTAVSYDEYLRRESERKSRP
jgi:hypothetical protein